MESVPKKPRITEVSPHLICALCGGYLIDATTIVECLHSFCKTCIVRYLESSKYCPICEVLVHKTKPLQNIRLDQTLQDIVYKLVPGLFKDEMTRRRQYYRDSPTIRSKSSRHAQRRQRMIYSADELFSVSLQLCPDGRIPSSVKKKAYHGRSTPPTDRRFLLCPAATSVSQLKKLLATKYGIPHDYQIGVFHEQGTVRDHYTLMDVAYIYSWNRTGVLQLYYYMYRDPTVVPKIEITEVKQEPISTEEVSNVERCTPEACVTEHCKPEACTTEHCKPEACVTEHCKPEACKPPSSLCAPSLLSRNCCDHNLPHDLSPLELIATVANDISCLEQGRGLKRNVDAIGLCYDNEEETSSEIQIRKSIEHAIEVCYNSNPDVGDSSTKLGEINNCVTPEIPSAAENKTSDSVTVSAVNNSLTIPTVVFPKSTISSSNPAPPKEDKAAIKSKTKPKTTETASQCDPRPKKQKTSETADKYITHSRNTIKQTKVVRQTSLAANNQTPGLELDTKDIPLKIVENNNIDTNSSHDESQSVGSNGSSIVTNQKSHLSQLNGVCKSKSACPSINTSSASKGKS